MSLSCDCRGLLCWIVLDRVLAMSPGADEELGLLLPRDFRNGFQI